MSRIKQFFTALFRGTGALNMREQRFETPTEIATISRVDETNVSPEESVILRDFANDLIECGMVDQAIIYGLVPFATRFKEGPRLQSGGKANFVKKPTIPRETVAVVSNIL